MSTRPRTTRAKGAVVASLTALLGLLGTSLLGPAQSAAAQDGASGAPQLQAAAVPEASHVVDVGGGDRVEISPIDSAGDSVVTALPGTSDAAPGLMTERTDAGTTVQTTNPHSVPTLVEGRPTAQAEEAVADATVPLHFEVTGRDGRPADAHINIFDVETGATWTRQLYAHDDPGAECSADQFAETTCALVPPGTYSVLAVVSTLPAERPSLGAARTFQNVSLVGSPETTVDAERTFDLDARDANPVNVRTPGHRTKVPAQGMLQFGYDRTAANGAGIHFNMYPNVLLDQHFYLQPTAEVSTGSFQTRTRIRLDEPDIELSAPFARKLHPEYVDAAFFADLPSDFPMVDGTSKVRVVDVGHATPADLAGVKLHGALALVTHADGLPLAEQSNRAAAHGASVVVIRNDGPGDIADPGGVGVMLQVPTIRLDRAEGRALGRLSKKDRVTVRGEPASPYTYDLYLKNHGRVPDDPSFVARTQELSSQVRTVHGQPTLGSTFSEHAAAFQPGDTVVNSRTMPFRGDARTRVEYRVPDPDTRWQFVLDTPESQQNNVFPHPVIREMTLQTPAFQLFTAPVPTPFPVAAAPITSGPNPLLPVRRSGDTMNLYLEPFQDQDHNHGLGGTRGDFVSDLKFLVDGVLLGEVDDASSVTAHLQPGPSTITLTYTNDNPQPWVELSTHTETTWTFPTDTAPAGPVTIQPMLLADYDVDVDVHNRVRVDHGQPVSFLVALGHPDGAPRAAVRTVRVDASYDGGNTWQKAKAVKSGGRWRVTLPTGTGYVSLRLRADDTGGSAIDQTVIRAFDVTR